MILSSVFMPISEMLLKTASPEFRAHNEWLKWCLIAPGIGLQGAGIMFCLPVLTTVLSNAARPDIQGLTQGTAQSISSLLRGLGPITMGSAFTLTYHIHAPAISFALLGIAYSVTLMLVWNLPESVEEKATSKPKGGWSASERLSRSRSYIGG
eukprot:CAMPEP_0180319116 /NCGR_PEP_ID=MMETSP0988-20121125/34816_1 /TAXON_ID=697907 /ORGANISM="non described non described, Strain CCMP2293" /LENGTH=152 /DNA_ID=CAMNT_0022304651 /DNA_START=85 /DNA_END=540 /DNA_ORIENTATION=+